MARPKGQPKLGGRQKGTPNKMTAVKEAAIAASGLTPLAFMLDVLRDDKASEGVRMDAAKAAAPYCHPKLATIDTNISGDMTFTVVIQRFGEIAHQETLLLDRTAVAA